MPTEMTRRKPPTAPDPAAVHQVYSWILSGASEHEIQEAIAAKFPNAKPKPLIVEAMGRIARAAEPDAAVLRGWAIEATRQIYQRCLEACDYPTALRAAKQLRDFTEKR